MEFASTTGKTSSLLRLNKWRVAISIGTQSCFIAKSRLADLQRYVYIANERGERRPLVYFVPPRVPGDVRKLVLEGKVEF